jgi:hypothetical protein
MTERVVKGQLSVTSRQWSVVSWPVEGECFPTLSAEKSGKDGAPSFRTNYLELTTDYCSAVAKRLLTSCQLTTFHQAAR